MGAKKNEYVLSVVVGAGVLQIPLILKESDNPSDRHPVVEDAFELTEQENGEMWMMVPDNTNTIARFRWANVHGVCLKPLAPLQQNGPAGIMVPQGVVIPRR